MESPSGGEGHTDEAETQGSDYAPEPWPGGPAPGALHTSSPPFRSVGFTISTTGHAIARGFHETLAPLDLEPKEFALLRAVAAAEGETQHATGERLQIPSSRMVAFIDALEARGLIERRSKPNDRRARALYLTDAGRELLGRAFELAAGYERNLCADLSEPEREQLLELLERVGARIGVPPAGHAAHSALTHE